MDWTFRTTAVALAPLSKSDPQAFYEFLQPYVRHIQHGWYIPAALVLSPFFAWVRRGADSQKLDDVHAILNQIRDKTFDQDADFEEHDRRVTLFRYRRLAARWPFYGEWLVPVERSGSMTRRTMAIFRVGDRAKDCEGIAGRAWSRNSNYYVGSLPDVRTSAHSDIVEYADKSFISVERVKGYLEQQKGMPRSLLGIPVEVRNQKWGVIVFDSVEPNFNRRKAEGIVATFTPTLTSYLRR